jgi:hypothetical protein
MNMHLGIWTFTVAGFLGLMASCSSDSDDGDESRAGSAGTSSGAGGRAGATSGGSKSGGSTSAGTSNNGGSSNPNGGNASNGGSSFGGFSFGGAGFDPDDFACNPAPQPGQSCDQNSQPCLNGTEVCYCDAEEWACMDVSEAVGGAGPGGGFGELECPATKPMTGADCGDTAGFCPYGGQFMGCVCYEGAWNCN